MNVISAHTEKEHYRTEIKSASNIIISDEPESVGGKNTGFSPFDLLAAALAACTCSTLRMYAERKEWDLTNVKVDVTFERDIKENKSKIVRTIELTGNLDDSQKARLLTIANNCPVHKTLTNPIEIQTEII